MPNISNDPEEAQIGKDLGSREFVADDGLLKDYFEGLEIEPDWYSGNPYQAQVRPLHDGDGCGWRVLRRRLQEQFRKPVDAPAMGTQRAHSAGTAVHCHFQDS